MSKIQKIKSIFVNLPVKDLDKSIEFFTKMGFTFNSQFTDENATCLVLGENIFVMLVVEKFFRGFTEKPISNPFTNTETINTIEVESRKIVDELIKKAINAGGKESIFKEDNKWMYVKSFEDLDGHQWEIVYMDMKKFPEKEVK